VLDNLFGPHAAHLSAAMTQTTRRHSLLSENLSNVNTPGYKRRDLDFGIELERAIGSKSSDSRYSSGGPRFTSAGFDETRDMTDVRVDGSSVDLEKEVVNMAETELRYQALTDMTSRYFSGLKNVIREGR
jgi:flagellar basal-body rod protein FlgB